jgi:uncharacterized protein YnzC (UPF0291/DUF896 family)
MITKEMIARINFLSQKQRSEGLTDEEKDEQAKVRRQYLDGIRGQMKATLDNVTIVDPEALSPEDSQQFETLQNQDSHNCGCGCGGGGGHGHGKGHGKGQGHGHGKDHVCGCGHKH